MRELTVAITGLAPMAPGRTVIRALREAFPGRLRFVGLSYGALEPGNYEPDLLERSYLLPFGYNDAEQVFDRLRKVQQDGGLDVIFPTLDPELPILSKLEPRLADMGIKCVIPTRDGIALRSKAALPELAVKAHLVAPLTRVAHSMDQVWSLVSEFHWPFFVKGQFFEAYLVHTNAQVESAFAHLANTWGLPVVLQENVPGLEFDVMALGDGKGNMLGAVPMKKLQLDDKNKAWGGITVDDPELIEVARKVVSAMKWRGVLEVEVIRHASGNIVLIEINPRPPAWAYLTVAAGQNLIAAAFQQAIGEKVEPFTDYKVGAMHLRQCVDVVSPIEDYESLVMKGQVDRRGRMEGA